MSPSLPRSDTMPGIKDSNAWPCEVFYVPCHNCEIVLQSGRRLAALAVRKDGEK